MLVLFNFWNSKNKNLTFVTCVRIADAGDTPFMKNCVAYTRKKLLSHVAAAQKPQVSFMRNALPGTAS